MGCRLSLAAGRVRGACATSLSRPEVAQAWPQQRCGPRCPPQRMQQPGGSHASVVLFGVRCPQEHKPARLAPLFMPSAAWAPWAPGVPLPVSGKSAWRLHAREGVILGWKPVTVAPLERVCTPRPPPFLAPARRGSHRNSLPGSLCWDGLAGMAPPGWSGRESWGSGWWGAAVSSAVSHLPNVTLASGRKRVKEETRNKNLLRKNLNGCFWL